jgi:hypothetical protein
VSDPTIEKIKEELFRLHARPEDVGVDGTFVVEDRGNGNAVIQCRRGRDFYWTGSAEEIFELSSLPDAEGKNGPELVRSEFA